MRCPPVHHLTTCQCHRCPTPGWYLNAIVLVGNALRSQTSSKTRGNLIYIEQAMKMSSVMNVEKNLVQKEIFIVIRKSSMQGSKKIQAKIRTKVFEIAMEIMQLMQLYASCWQQRWPIEWCNFCWRSKSSYWCCNFCHRIMLSYIDIGYKHWSLSIKMAQTSYLYFDFIIKNNFISWSCALNYQRCLLPLQLSVIIDIIENLHQAECQKALHCKT